MNKKILSLVLALVMVLGAFTTVFAEEATTEKVEKVVGKDNKIQYVIDKKLVEGYGDGDYGYDKNIKRSEITKLLVYANGNKALAEKLQGSMQLYSDVDHAYWANGVISVGSTVPSAANGQPMLNGYPDGSFKPENDVTYAELAKMLVVLVKKDLTADMVKQANANWASQWMTWAAQLGILDDVVVANSDAAANRADAFTMLYNALYKMTAFKRVPANEKIGVLSALNRSKLTLNQDSEQTYTITDETVFVLAGELSSTNSNVIKVKSINDPDYYLGSLVRIMVNDKKEVSHILELGNPRYLALGLANDKLVGDNARWQGVADATVETPYTNVATLNTTMKPVMSGWAKINFNSAKTKVDSITFQTTATTNVATVKVNSDTKVYVANPANNQMREVKNIDEAMTLIGYDKAKWDMIPNVYAGFDTDGHVAAIHGYNTDGRNTAKVVVFNVVTKAKGGDAYRIINQATSLGNATLEKTNGELADKNLFGNISAFPYNYGDLYDVIELKWYSGNNNYDQIAKVIDHSNTDKYPIVQIVRTYNDGKSLEVVDQYGYKALIDTRDADIFSAKRFDKLVEGAKIQFATEDQNKAVDTVSILPREMAVKGSLRAVFSDAVYGNTYVGRVISVHVNGNNSTVAIDAYNNIFDKDANQGYTTFYVSEDTARALKNAYEGKEVNFKVTDMSGIYGRYYAQDFHDNATGRVIAPVSAPLTALEAAQAAIEKAIQTKSVADVLAAEEALQYIPAADKDNLETIPAYVTAKATATAVAAADADAAVEALKVKLTETMNTGDYAANITDNATAADEKAKIEAAKTEYAAAKAAVEDAVALDPAFDTTDFDRYKGNLEIKINAFNAHIAAGSMFTAVQPIAPIA
ncbi:putative transposase [Peptoniphilus sp. ING2-D1G]|nr:putative transposase [Peptoniphilus sp. ING2-D1G]